MDPREAMQLARRKTAARDEPRVFRQRPCVLVPRHADEAAARAADLLSPRSAASGRRWRRPSAPRSAAGGPLVCVEGDGSALQNIQELDTVARLGLKFLYVVVNDEAYGAEYHKLRAHERDPNLSVRALAGLRGARTRLRLPRPHRAHAGRAGRCGRRISRRRRADGDRPAHIAQRRQHPVPAPALRDGCINDVSEIDANLEELQQ